VSVFVLAATEIRHLWVSQASHARGDTDKLPARQRNLRNGPASNLARKMLSGPLQEETMATIVPLVPALSDPVVETTLLELVRVVSEVTDDDREVVATVMEMLRSGRVRLCGTLRGATLDAA
jgi:hypothetical protein